MAKTPSARLYDLIHSLTGTEKRHFKLYAREGDNKYNLLFDAMEKQDVFDDYALQELVYPGENIQSRKYSELKAYLYDLILQSLQRYDEHASVDFRIKGYLQHVRVLYRRSRFAEAVDQLAKARRVAIQFEQYTALLEILNWEKQLAYANMDVAFLTAELSRISKEETEAYRELHLCTRLRNLFFELWAIIRQDPAPGQSARQRLLKWKENLDLPETATLTSYTSSVLSLRLQSLMHYAGGEQKAFYRTGKDLLDLMESNRHFLEEDVSEYISALSNFMRSCGELNRIAELEESLEKLRRLKPNTPDDELKIHRQYYQIKFALCIQQADFQEGMRALDNHLQEKEKFNPAFFDRQAFFYTYFYICFGAGDFDRALSFLNQWLQSDKGIERQDLQALARILNLVIHYELGNSVLLDSLLRSTYRFLKKRNSLHQVEQKFIEGIKEAIEAGSAKTERMAFEKLGEEYKRLAASSPQARKLLTRPFHLLAWVDSKIRNQPFYKSLSEYEK